MRKLVLQLDIHDDGDKQKAIKAVSRFAGIDSISVNMKQGQLTVIGDLDPIQVVGKLRKQLQADIVSVGPAKEEKKVDDKQGGKGGGGGDAKKEGAKATPGGIGLPAAQYYYTPPPPPPPYEENPTVCVIC